MAERYSEFETLRDGTRLEIRAQQPDDRAAMLEVFGRMSNESRYTRFFAPKRGLSEAEIAHFMTVDFVDHVALAAIARAAGLDALHAEVLAENAPRRKVFEKSGLAMSATSKQGVVHIALSLHRPLTERIQ